MYFLYNLALLVVSISLNFIAPFRSKINLFVKGRRATFSVLERNITANDEVIWIHTASLGEFEQGLPVIEQIKANFPGFKILISFFSPSGYEIKKDTDAADVVCYLPLDSAANARKFIKAAHPKIALFVKYEIWPNFLRELQRNGVPTILISAIFKEEQIFFKWYGGFMRRTLKKIDHFFVQNTTSEALLNQIGIRKVTVAGDTRFDRVNAIKAQDRPLAFMENFKQDTLCFVAGSTWPEDEKIIVPYINSTTLEVKFVMAPHNIKKDHVEDLRKSISKKTVLFSEKEQQDLHEFQVLIVDTIGLLSRIYSYADVAYVGGGFATGLHNTLEPAVFGIPVLIGPKYSGFKEAEEMVKNKGCFSLGNQKEFKDKTDLLLTQHTTRESAGQKNISYIEKNKGASIQIIGHLRTLL
ncbi:MAG: 3-deoxy-D-manno-octulosonic acid transferase [Eudoraea sp.]|nr:3-deoxy-D-manno-octulosonic acid transferase [Eudoraea sp.]